MSDDPPDSPRICAALALIEELTRQLRALPVTDRARAALIARIRDLEDAIDAENA